MSTSFYTKTVVIDPAMKSHAFNNANELMIAQPVVLPHTSGLKTFKGSGTVMTEVFGSSKSNYFSLAVGNLCALASIEGLEVFTGRLSTPAHWRFSPNEEEDGAWAHTCGYWLEGPTLSTTLDALDKLLSWSRKNARELELEEFLSYYLEESNGIVKAIKRGERVNDPRMRDADLHGEGTGPGYLFAYLGTLRHLLGNAIVSGHAVLHVAEIEGPDLPAGSPAPTPFAIRYDAQYWLNEGDTQYEDAEVSDGREATTALKAAIKCYSTALGMNPKLAEAHCGWARALCERARNSSGKKAKEFWSSAIIKFEQALAMEAELTSNVYDVLTETGGALYELSRFSKGEEAKVLRESARVKYDAGLKLLPEEPGFLYQAGSVRLSLAKCSENTDRERLLREAEVNFRCAEKAEPGSAAYDLACVSALGGDTVSALTWLKSSASHGTLPSREHIKGDADLKLIRSDPEFVAWFAK
jgi:tetratricopeptide (TPR) repeat protein